MHKQRTSGGVWVLLVLVLLAVGAPRSARATADPWYEDVWPSFWAYREISILWDEGCTDGWRYRRHRRTRRGWREETVAYFRPDHGMTRAEYATLMAKAFRLSPTEGHPVFRDVPSDYTICDREPAYGYIQAGASLGWFTGSGDGYFRPDATIERQHAVAILIRALGLKGLAPQLVPSPREYLRRFPDGHKADPSVAQEMAIAVRLGIVIGFHDGTLRPRAPLTRAEGATMLARSALIDVWAQPPRFSPDSDGVEDTTRFAFRTLRNRATESWDLRIGNLEGDWYRTFQPGRNDDGPPPELLNWDGTDDRGRPLRDGLYLYQARIWDERGNAFRTAQRPLLIDRRRLWGSLHPSQIAPGESLTIKAGTTGGALRVRAAMGGAWVDLVPRRAPSDTGENTWSGCLPTSPQLREGLHSVEVIAEFTGVRRSLNLECYVRDPLSLSGRLEPNPARAGDEVTVSAFVSGAAERVTAQTPWGAGLALRPAGPGVWTGVFTTDPTVADGSYPVMLYARRGDRFREHELSLVIEGSRLSDLVFSLTE